MAKIMIARCPRCGGWTMFHADPNSGTAFEWAYAARKSGDTVSLVDDTEVGAACPDADGKDAAARTCGQVAASSEASP